MEQTATRHGRLTTCPAAPMQKATGVGVVNVLNDAGGLPKALTGLNLTEAEAQDLPAVMVRPACLSNAVHL